MSDLSIFSQVRPLIDTHCHLDFPPFCDDLSATLAQAEAAGVRMFVVPAVTAERFAGVCALASEHPSIYAALGLHPLYITQHGEDQLAQLAQNLAAPVNKKIVAVGEIGLDLYMEHPQLEQQLWLLDQQLQLAKHYNLPVILHSRRTHDILAKALKKAALPCTGVIHGFSGSLAQAQAFIRLGYKIGVGGIITYPRAQKTRQTIAALPLSSLLLETDSPDMPLMGLQGQPNRPEYIVRTFAVLCALRHQESPAMIAEALYQNSHQFFRFQ